MNAFTSGTVAALVAREQGIFKEDKLIIFSIPSKVQTSLNCSSLESFGLELKLMGHLKIQV
jgi:hypothetical protein